MSTDRVFDPVPDTDAFMFIQWKGTDLCMDFTCSACGASYHVHGDFAYHVRCTNCGAVYEMGTQVRAIRLKEDEIDPQAATIDMEDDPRDGRQRRQEAP